MTNVMKSDT